MFPPQAVEGLLEGVGPLASDAELSLRYRDCHLIVLRGLQDPRGYGPMWTARHVTKLVTEHKRVKLKRCCSFLSTSTFQLYLENT